MTVTLIILLLINNILLRDFSHVNSYIYNKAIEIHFNSIFLLSSRLFLSATISYSIPFHFEKRDGFVFFEDAWSGLPVERLIKRKMAIKYNFNKMEFI